MRSLRPVTSPLSFSAALPDFIAGRQTPRDFLERCLAAIAARDAGVKAFVTLDVERARAAADAATARYRAGKPLSMVDGCPAGIMDTHDMPTQMGSPVFTGWQPRYDAACVHALRAGGAVLVGKTASTAFACGGPTATTNPYDARRTPGGSSSGSAAAVGAGMLPAALGTQTQGSTLRPASYCGAVGFKPTHGALSMQGVHPISATHDHLGVIAATLEDAWRIASHIALAQGSPGYASLAGASAELPPAVAPRRLIRLYTEGWMTETSPQTRDAFTKLIMHLCESGVGVAGRDDDPGAAAIEAVLDAGFAERSLEITAYEMLWPYEQYVERHGALMEQRVHDRMRQARGITPARYESLLAEKQAVVARVRDLAADADAFVMLAASGPAPVGLQHTGSRAFLTHATFLGFPAFSLPLMTVDGMPLGLQVIGFPGRDRELCGLARWLMHALEGKR
jgi:Asp-tRNA(Asn)/Glu-tRNA(Gln) amidotransferase A subunit family amidase